MVCDSTRVMLMRVVVPDSRNILLNFLKLEGGDLDSEMRAVEKRHLYILNYAFYLAKIC